MKLAIQSSLDGMMRQANVLAGRVGNLVEETQAAASAKEALNEISIAGEALMRFYGDLHTVQASLENNGFSQEWLDMVNKDNRFLDAINVDLVNLVGTDTDKCEVCMEGILGAIWDVIKRIWRWIIDAVGKLCSWLKRVLMVYRMKGYTADKMRYLMRSLQGKEDLPEILKILGKTLNEEGGRGGKGLDMRGIIERASVFRVIAAFFNNGIVDILGLQTVDKKNVTDSQLVSRALLEIAQSGKDPENPIMTKFKEFLSRDQSQINEFSNMSTSGFKDGFTVMKNPSGFRDMMNKAGIGIVDGGRGAGAVTIKPIQDVVDDVDYAATYTTVEQFDGVFCEAFYREEGLCVAINSTIETANTFLKYTCDCITLVLDDLKAYAMSGGKAETKHVTVPVDPALGRALQLQARYVSETIALMTKMASEMVNTMNYGVKLRDIYVKVCEKYLK